MRVTGYTTWRESSKIFILLNYVEYSKEFFEEAEKAVIEDSQNDDRLCRGKEE